MQIDSGDLNYLKVFKISHPWISRYDRIYSTGSSADLKLTAILVPCDSGTETSMESILGFRMIEQWKMGDPYTPVLVRFPRIQHGHLACPHRKILRR